MYCPKCGSQNDDNALKCVQCEEVLREGGENGVVPQKIPNYLAQSILVTLFCCMPFGIAAIVFAAQVNGKVQAGDIEGALESSRKAKMWSWWSFGLGLLVVAAQIIFQVVIMATTVAAEGGGY